MSKEQPLIIAKRFLFNAESTLSKTYVKGDPFCFGMEDERRKLKVKGETCIPDGIYPLGLHPGSRFAARLGHAPIHIQNVPGFEYILIHPGNTDLDTEGCYLPGSSIDFTGTRATVLSSKIAYTKLYNATIAAIKKGGQYMQFITLNPLNAL